MERLRLRRKRESTTLRRIISFLQQPTTPNPTTLQKKTQSTLSLLRPFSTFSGGERMKATLARGALANVQVFDDFGVAVMRQKNFLQE
jgi:ATPase subunit of ABC transporter with duplicated ATPase domains